MNNTTEKLQNIVDEAQSQNWHCDHVTANCWYFDYKEGAVTNKYNPNCEPLKLKETKLTRHNPEIKQQKTIKAKSVWIKKHNAVYKNKLENKGE